MRDVCFGCLWLAMLVGGGCGGPSRHAPDAGDGGSDAEVSDIPDDTGDGGDGGGRYPFELELAESRGAGSGTSSAFAWITNLDEKENDWVPTLTVGDCVYNTPQPEGFCDPACLPPQMCRHDNTCGPPPSAVSAGEIVVTGLRVGLTLRPLDPYLYYEAVWNPEPADGDLFAGGDVLTATAAGGTVPAFSVSTLGVDALVTDLPCPLTLGQGVDLEVTWSPGGGDDRVVFSLQSGNHGNQFSSVVCTTADDGHLRVDASLLDAFAADFHPVQLWILRREREDATVAGPADVRLRAVSRVTCYQ
ncbi:MAG: hypothetical protein CVU59_08190 [Deltaproteobacteria bacterium HGW-Deltaproteobacteria-17]|nr:MAG: hypothetical protein CVU59_08190 [Deltaproteobacteria bacterium HGW-Deltaproteobacteria-17]